ncbi:hypothetical protein BH09BAC4_BH09BAC4_01570 [soil metagenome]
MKGLFLNAKSINFVAFCANEEIIANVIANPRNSASHEEAPDPDGTHIFDDVLYADRPFIKHANAWIDDFKALLVRFEFLLNN